MYLKRHHDITISESGVWRILHRLGMGRSPASRATRIALMGTSYQRARGKWSINATSVDVTKLNIIPLRKGWLPPVEVTGDQNLRTWRQADEPMAFGRSACDDHYRGECSNPIGLGATRSRPRIATACTEADARGCGCSIAIATDVRNRAPQPAARDGGSRTEPGEVHPVHACRWVGSPGPPPRGFTDCCTLACSVDMGGVTSLQSSAHVRWRFPDRVPRMMPQAACRSRGDLGPTRALYYRFVLPGYHV
jgi:hypothetical protein